MEYYGKILCISAQDLTYDDRPVAAVTAGGNPAARTAGEGAVTAGGNPAARTAGEGAVTAGGNPAARTAGAVVDGDWSRSRVLNGRRPEELPMEILAPIMSDANYKQLKKRGQINVVRRGGGASTYALIEVATLPLRFRERIKEKYGDMEVNVLKDWFGQHYRLDAKAREFYTRFRFGDGGSLPPEKINEYTVNASVLQAVAAVVSDTNIMRRAMHGTTVNWGEIVGVISYYKAEYEHTLPLSAHRFRDTLKQFQTEGYEVLISKKFRNQNTRKVSYDIERLILSLDSLPERPYNTTVAELYNMFVKGEVTVADPETGEVFEPSQFVDKKGNPLVLSDATIANYLNTPKNKALRAKLHDTQWDFNNAYRPYHLRSHAVYALSKVSLDDRDLPRPMPNGQRVKAYYAYDVVSGAVVGRAYNRLKTRDLFIDCMRDMFRMLDRNGFYTPMELEVEHHLVESFSDGLMKAGVVFPMVRWCNPGNSREKRAEHFNRAKKYGTEKKLQVGIGRWYSKLEANRPKVEKVYDEKNDTYKEKSYSYEELVADDIRAIEEYNHELHPNQKMYPGMTRWDVLCARQNPELRPWDKSYLYRYIGEKTTTTIRQNMYVTVQYEQYQLPSPKVIEKLEPRNLKVDAYWLPEADPAGKPQGANRAADPAGKPQGANRAAAPAGKPQGANKPGEVYLWQGDEFICVCKPVSKYNEATAEQTEADRQAYVEQAKYVSRFDKMMKEGKIQKVVVMHPEETEAIETAVEGASPAGKPQGADMPEDEDYSEYMDADRYAMAGVASM